MIAPAVKLLLIVLWFVPLFPFLLLCHLAKWDSARQHLIQVFHKVMLLILGIRVTVEGQPAEERPLLLVTNHVTYLDIVVMGSVTYVCFVPKAEIAGWPIIGFLCRLSDCVFIERRASRAQNALSNLRQKLAQHKKIICLFPEGTTTVGKRTLPFKSSLFSLAEEEYEGRTLPVQPATLVYTHINNLPLDDTQRPRIAWIGDLYLMPHLWGLLKLGTIRVKVVFHPAVTISQFGSRKELAAYCQQQISGDLERARDTDMMTVAPSEARAG